MHLSERLDSLLVTKQKGALFALDLDQRKALNIVFNRATNDFDFHHTPGKVTSELEAIDIDGTRANGYLFQIETAYRVSAEGIPVSEIPITFVDRDSARAGNQAHAQSVAWAG